MALVITQVASMTGSDPSDLTSYTTPSWTPNAGSLYILVLYPVQNSGAQLPAVSGNGMTWDRVGSVGGEYGGAGSGRAIWMFKAVAATPSAGAITINFSPTSMLGCGWQLIEITGADTGGTNGSNAIVQAIQSLGSSSTTGGGLTLAAFGSANNEALAAFSHGFNETSTVGTGYTALGNAGYTPPAMGCLSEHKLNDTGPTATWATSSPWGAIAVEVKAATGSPPANTVAPAVTGTAQVGSTLATDNGTWTGAPTSYSYQWKRADDAGFTLNVTNIGANQNQYLLTATEQGKYVRCVVTATNANGSTGANSNIVGPIAAAPAGGTPDKVLHIGAHANVRIL